MSIEPNDEWVHFLFVKGKLDLCLEIITTAQNEHKHTHECFGLFLYPLHTHTQIYWYFQNVIFIFPKVLNECHKRYAKWTEIVLL